MKRSKITILLAIVLGMTFHSCLDLEPQDQLGGKNMWTSVNDYKQFANTFYSWTRDFSSVVYDGTHSDKRSDLITYQSYNEFSRGINSIPSSDANYTDNYKHIRRTNLLLQNAEAYAKPEDIKQYIGEAYFFRAYSYFDLLQLYGDVIITKKPLDITDPEMKVKRNDRSEVVDLIIDDLNHAVENLPAFKELTTEEEGRISKEGAQAFLSRVALYEGTWQKSRNGNQNTQRSANLLDIAAKAARTVIDAKYGYTFRLSVPNNRNVYPYLARTVIDAKYGYTFRLFGTDSETKILGDSAQKYMFILENEKSNPAGIKKSSNHEYIFARRHDQVLASIGKNITQECLANVQWVTRKFANLYLCDDGLPIEKSGRFQKYDKKVSEFLNRDNRMRYTLLKPGTRYWGNKFGRTSWQWDETDLKTSKVYDPASGTCYGNQKWSAERVVPDTQEGYDFPLIRYAEVLLNYAEAIYERDDKIENEDLNISLNLVRQRVNTNMPALTNELTQAHGLDMRTEIRRERTVELFNEGFRIDDLKRWKTAENEMPQTMLGIKWKGTEYESWNTTFSLNDEGCVVVETGRQWADKNYLYPLPSDQLQLNPTLGQNPGWGE